MEEVGFHPLHDNGFNTDVWAWVGDDDRLYATSGTWGTLPVLGAPVEGDPCPSETDVRAAPQKSGVKIIDATDPADPQLVSSIGVFPGSQNNDVKILRLDTASFDGHVLAHSLEPCGAEGLLYQVIGPPFTDVVGEVPAGSTGFELYDVRDPANPVHLATFSNGGIGTHNLYMFDRPDLGRAFVAAVYNEVGVVAPIRGVLQIVEITDPAAPTLVGTWELADAGLGGCAEARGVDSAMCYLHDVWVGEDGRTAYLSYWDAGLVLLDLTVPESPAFMGRALEQVQSDDPEGWLNEEGNTHVAVPMTVGDRRLVIVGDEDFTGPGVAPFVVIDSAPSGAEVAAGEEFAATEMTDTRPLADGAVGPLPIVVSDDGFGCVYTAGAALTAVGQGWIGVGRRGGECAAFQTKVTAAEAAGASGVIIVNEGSGSTAGTAAGTIPAVMIGQPEGDRLIASYDPADVHALQVSLGLLVTPELDPWGFARVVDVTDPDPANWREVDQFKAPHVEDTTPGTFSAHNPIVGPDNRIYFAWYTDGVRVLEASETGAVSEMAWFVPRADDHPDDLDQDPHLRFGPDAGFWGSYPICHPTSGELLVFNSDINRGIYILRPTYDIGTACGGDGGGGGDDHAAAAAGGGYLETDDGGKANFGFNAKADGTGHLQFSDKGAGVKVMIEAFSSVGHLHEVCGGVEPGGDAVEMVGEGSFDGAPATFRVCVADDGEPGNSGAGGSDAFHLECLEGCTYSTAGRTADAVIDGGNIQVHGVHGDSATGTEVGSDGSTDGGSPSTSVLVVGPLLVTEAPVGGLLSVVVTAYGPDGNPVEGALVELSDGSLLMTDESGRAVVGVPVSVGLTTVWATSGDIDSNVLEVTGLTD